MKPCSYCWTRWLLPSVIAGLAAFLLLWPAAQAGPAVASVTLEDHQFRVSGPYVQGNLAAYLVHTDKPQDERRFITLQEGLEKKWVTVAEKEQESVGELMVENKTDHFLYLQDGDLLEGGKQDRTIYATHIVPPRTKEAAKSFCVEPSRWHEGSTGRAFANPTNLALAPKEIKQAAKFRNDQSAVWANVAEQRGNIASNQNYAVNFQTSSFNEARKHETLKADVKRLAGPIEADIRRELRWNPDVVGIAVTVNGKVEEVVTYPNCQLLEKVFPRLLEAYAERAVLQKDVGTNPASVREVAQFMRLDKQQQVAAANQSRDQAGQQQANQRQGRNLLNNAFLRQHLPGLDPAPNQEDGRAQTTTGEQSAMQPVNGAMRISFYERAVNDKNRFDVQETAGKYACTTKFEGKTVGYQFTSRAQAQPQAQPRGWRGQFGGQQGQFDQQIEQRLNNTNRPQQPVPPQNADPFQRQQSVNPPVRINNEEPREALPTPRTNDADPREALPAPREEERLPAPAVR